MTDYNDWNAKVIDEFRAKGGKGVGQFGDALLLLHHTGARTGVERVSPLARLEDGDRLVIVASRAGAPQNPNWFHNLKAHPDTTIEVGTETRAVRAVEITGDDYEQTWARVTAAMPNFAEYQTRTTRRIPLVALLDRD
ncbi:nitroreductase family deazaflavin-dependent oxidoreductase [Actinoplanes sp. M2I2]|uniref:nitroreductase family deazaflavin-dependent oxidoreductase n=1 Tax=Actinoplanes sp. M2I2 TaxID=1734444 RepID=UPI00201FC735|nr:nitroreductase family deazaflavin-dependent oxidoreductase [Actinoplanes sp. M2I2]